MNRAKDVKNTWGLHTTPICSNKEMANEEAHMQNIPTTVSLSLDTDMQKCLTRNNMSASDNDISTNVDTHGSYSFSHYTVAIENAKQKIAMEDIKFVRFEATDLHGVSRSKIIPTRYFQEKLLYGVAMPRSYLELTLSPKENEVDHTHATNFSSDVLLIPDLSTFRTIPWAEQTARVICDSCTVTGHPLRTSPRLIAKLMLGQLQGLGFSLRSCFTYECCVFAAPEKISPKVLFFPGATLMSNDLPFFQQLISSMYFMGVDVESFASANEPGQMEISLQPEFGLSAADSAFSFRTGTKELARKNGYIASFFTDNGFYNSGILSHSVWDISGKKNIFHSGRGELSEVGKKWLAGLLRHSAALSCLMAPGDTCRRQMMKVTKDSNKHVLYATCGCNNHSCNFNVKVHGSRGTHIENKLGSAMANPYLVLAATVAAGMDGIRENLTLDTGPSGDFLPQRKYGIPVKLEEALTALWDDHVMREALGESFVQYFIAMKRYEIETQELDAERNKCLGYFV